MDAHHHGSSLTHPTATDHHVVSTDDSGEKGLHGATRPGDDLIVHPTGSVTAMEDTQTRVPFKAKVEGYAKKFAGKTFGKEDEVAAGEARLRGEDEPKHYKQ
ncbi:hypothetical protein VP01_2879g2 [Puccinia sorghi]|uniref:Uncharacterized protein n=1 Tax=Puccinia sorghi TaxID=27349 RepID=A0A0L6V1Q2_9BASI|nr:hypothetical protein VP01_2879g2 [Puccinia sorghi]